MRAQSRILIWLYSCCFMIFAMAVIGAITRLTESGLSITEWQPITGTLPPLHEQEWERVFALYKNSPEFMHKHSWMSLEDFKKIFFWEWLHRLWGRLIGIVYAVPLIWFAIKKQLPAGYGWKFTGLLLLGGAQGFMGWFMVQSGLVDQPNVSHYRLAAHLGLALLLFSLIWWLALDIKHQSQSPSAAARPAPQFYSGLMKPYSWAVLIMVSLTILWGAFVAGLDAGLIYNSFPLMNGSFLPPENFSGPLSLLSEQSWVQFAHRWLAIITGLLTLGLAVRLQNYALGGVVLLQIGLGISTLLTQVNIILAALHQAGAIILLALLIKALYDLHHQTRPRQNAALK